MYNKIMVPVDLAHVDKLDKALSTAAELARKYAAPVVYVGVSSEQPGSVAHTPEEYASKLEAFAGKQAESHGIDAQSAAYVAHDPAVELNDKLLQAREETGADLVVMASHVPGLPEHIFSSHAGYVASHAPVSVFVIR